MEFTDHDREGYYYAKIRKFTFGVVITIFGIY